jgi:hypothetical protein
MGKLYRESIAFLCFLDYKQIACTVLLGIGAESKQIIHLF